MRLPKKYSSLKAKVVRNGVEAVIDSRTLVPGDLVVLDEGSMVPADCRLVDDFGLSVLETHVGGAKHSVAKDSRFIPNEIDTLCGNMLYLRTVLLLLFRHSGFFLIMAQILFRLHILRCGYPLQL